MTGRAVDQSNQALGRGHVLGAALFALALAAPIGLMALQSSDRPTMLSAETSAKKDAEAPAAHSVPVRSPRDLLRERLAGAVIQPGLGIGPLRLGAPYLLADARDAAPAAPGTESAATYLMRNDGWVLAVQTQGPERRITALEMSANSCATLADDPRTEMMPSTEAAVTLGTHRSRLQIGAAAEALVSLAERNDGIEMEFCPGTALVRTIRVLPWDDAGEPAVMVRAPGALEVLAVGGETSDLADAGGSATATVAQPQSLAHKKDQVEETAPRIAVARIAGTPGLGELPGHRSANPGGEDMPRDVAMLTAPDLGTPLYLATDSEAIPSRGVVGVTQRAAPAIIDPYRPIATSDTEERLALSRAERRELQRRLTMLGHPTGGADGILGPRSREAITALQAELGEVPTGYVNKTLVAEIRTRSAEPYAAWRREMKKAARRSNKIVQARLPSARSPVGCRRHLDGSIIENQSISCDVDLLSESLSRLFTF